MMSLDRYRLKHKAKESSSAKRVLKLLERPDRLLGVILLGNNFVNIMASAIAGLIAVRMFGEIGVLIASILLTIVVLIFAEVSPKTLAALYPEKVAYPTSAVLKALLWILYPLVWVINYLSNGLLRLLGVNIKKQQHTSLNLEELRTVVHEARDRIPNEHRSMLLSILDLEKGKVEDIMVPKNEVIGLDLDDDWEALKGQLANTQHSLLPVYKQDLNKFVGILHIKKAANILADDTFSNTKLIEILDKGYFVPEGTPLSTQLLNFQQNKQRFALVVDEYGDILGLVTLEDILEEIIGEFTTDMVATTHKTIHPQNDGSFLVEGGIAIRDLNKVMDFDLPAFGPRTLSGLIIEHLETIPEIGTCCLIDDVPIEVIQIQDNRIKTVKIYQKLERESNTPDEDK